jgi:hypothetical protein
MLKDRLLGAWSLVSLHVKWADGRFTYLLGENATGFICYDPSGFFSAQLMRQNRPLFVSNDMQRGEPIEINQAFEGYIAYWGRYEVNEETETVNYLPEGSLFPNWIGTVQPRKIEFEEGQITLSSQPMVINGLEGVGVVQWQRAG